MKHLTQQLQVFHNGASRVNSKYECTDHSKLLKSLNWLSVRQLIKYDTVVLMYKVSNYTVPEQINDLFTKSESTHHYWTRHTSNNKFLVNCTTTEKGKRAISVSGAEVWNELPRPIKEDRSLASFKAKLKELLLNDCK